MTWGTIYERQPRARHDLRLEDATPLVCGPADERSALARGGVKPKVVKVSEVAESRLWVHDETDAGAALALAQLWAPDYPIPLGVFANRTGETTYEQILIQQEQKAV